MERYKSHKSGVKARAKPQAKARTYAKTPVGVDTTPNVGGARFVAIVTVRWAIVWAFVRAIAWAFAPALPGLLPGYCLGFLKWNWNWPSYRMQYWNGSISISASSANRSLASQNLFSIAQLSYPEFLKKETANPNGRSAVYFNVHYTLQRMEDLVLEIQSCGDGNTAYDDSSYD